jgi:hypothetical protein
MNIKIGGDCSSCAFNSFTIAECKVCQGCISTIKIPFQNWTPEGCVHIWEDVEVE